VQLQRKVGAGVLFHFLEGQFQKGPALGYDVLIRLDFVPKNFFARNGRSKKSKSPAHATALKQPMAAPILLPWQTASPIVWLQGLRDGPLPLERAVPYDRAAIVARPRRECAWLALAPKYGRRKCR
jgi:hypothetical protein